MKDLSLFVIFVFSVLLSCSNDANQNSPIQKVLASKHPSIKKIVEDVDKFELQILFTKVEKDSNGVVSFFEDTFHTNDDTYFYPASSVKFPMAVLALEKLNKNEALDRNSQFKLKKDSAYTSFKNEIQKIFAVSDNEAYNRLFEFLGQDEINKQLNLKGIKGRISHRLSTENADRLITDTIYFKSKDTKVDVQFPIKNKPISALELKHIKKGKGYFNNDTLVNQAMDFSKKNYIPASSLHNMLKRLVYPEKFSENDRFNISENDRQFLLNSMSQLPKELGYNKEEYYDSYVKFLIFGDSKKDIPDHIKIYNKVGYAYGTLTDCAYVKNTINNTEYFITATLLVNSNEIFNDDTYEYESVGIPFLAELGRQLIRF